jgi:hypothetical protein
MKTKKTVGEAVVSVKIRADVYRAISAASKNRGYNVKRGIEFALTYVAAHPEIYAEFVREFLDNTNNKIEIGS